MFVYHRIPDNMWGTTLHPLSHIRQLHPELYNYAVKKYDGREKVMDQIVGLLNCKWNDVIHLTPLDPKETFRALKRAGGNPADSLFWKIPISMLSEDSTVKFEYEFNERGFEKKYSKFSKDEYKEMKLVPEKTSEYYREAFAQGGRPLMYHLVPHILTSKSIDVASLEVYSWNQNQP